MSATCRATGPRIWRRITSGLIRRRVMPSGAGSPSARASPRSCARSCRRRCAACSTACACPPMADRAGTGRRKGRWRKTRKRRCAAPAPRRSIRHARAVDAILATGKMDGKGSPEQMRELTGRPQSLRGGASHGSRDAEAAYVKKTRSLLHEAATGRVNRAIRALQLETELRTDPQRRADRFVERWRELGQTSQRQYQVGDMSGYKATRSAMGDMAKSLERDPQLESILAKPKAGPRHRDPLGPPARAGTRLQPWHRPRQRPGHRT